MSIKVRFFVCSWLACCSMSVWCDAHPDQMAGRIDAELNGKKVVLSPLQSDYVIDIRGDVVNVKLRQRFENPYAQALHATYLFPLNRQAAVHAMTMWVGDEVISAEIQEIRQAKQTFQRAKREGKAAALLEQHRPNMFTQRIANIVPGDAIEVEIQYSHVLPKVDGAYELVVPMVVGPRFQPAGTGVAPDSAQTGVWMLEQLPDYPATAGVNLPAHIAAERVSLRIQLESATTLQSVLSDTHTLSIRDVSSTQQEIQFAAGKEIDNRDFVLRIVSGEPEVSGGLLTHWQADEGGYFSLLIEPPLQVAPTAALPREMVFLLDCSGSMSGLPMQASKAFMQQALTALRPGDFFRIIRFSDQATEFSSRAMPATAENIQAGLSYTRALHGSGGTMMSSGISQALGAPPLAGVVRNVVFLTDGYIGNEVEVLSLVERRLGDARLYAFGVGSGVNRYLLSELGRVGRGFTRYFDPTKDDETMQQAVNQLVAKLQTPVLTDLSLDWGDLAVSDVLPAQLPDLYAGDSVRVTGRFAQATQGTLRISGVSRSQRASIEQPVHLADDLQRPSVRRLWARTAVAEQMHRFITPIALREDQVTNEQIQAAITDLGLSYGLTTRWTSFVAVSRARYNKSPQQSLDGQVALPKVAGVSRLAYAQQTVGGAAPEPGVWWTLVALFGLLAWHLRKQVFLPS